LLLNVQLANDFFAQAIVVTKGIAEREVVRARLEKALDKDFSGLNSRISALELGPPVGWPLQYRVSGRTPEGPATPRSWSRKRWGRTRIPD